MQTKQVQALKRRYQNEKHNYNQDFRLRIYRALSWLAMADEKLSLPEPELDCAFIALWIAFNAAYAQELVTPVIPARNNFQKFLHLICQFDNKQLYDLVWNQFSDDIRILIDNRYIFQPFWDYQNDEISEEKYLQSFQDAKKKANASLAKQETDTLLAIVFDRLYTLRNQIIHGGSTYGSSVNRATLKNGCNFLRQCMIAILSVMMTYFNNPAWGKPFYPLVDDNHTKRPTHSAF